jgi:hypothetical protein
MDHLQHVATPAVFFAFLPLVVGARRPVLVVTVCSPGLAAVAVLRFELLSSLQWHIFPTDEVFMCIFF